MIKLLVIIGTLMFAIVGIMTILLGCGCPLGEFTMGGQEPVLPHKLRPLVWGMLLIQILGAIILWQIGNMMPLLFSASVTRGIGIGFAVFLSINMIFNGLSKSRKERLVMTPIALITSITFWLVCFLPKG